MADAIQNLMNKVLGDMARPAKFRCMIYTPTVLNNVSSSDIDIYCKAASFPGITVENIEIDYKGRTIPVPGVQVYDQVWSCEFYNDENHKLRQLFLNWAEGSQYYNYNRKTAIHNSVSKNRIVSMMSIFQLDYELRKSTAVYNFYNVYPTKINEIEANYESTSQVQTFNVEFTYSHFDYKILEGPLSANDIAENIKSTIQGAINDAFDVVAGAARDVVSGVSDKIIGSIKSSASQATGYFTNSFKNFLD